MFVFCIFMYYVLSWNIGKNNFEKHIVFNGDVHQYVQNLSHMQLDHRVIEVTEIILLI
jgi:hypothetical protein